MISQKDLTAFIRSMMKVPKSVKLLITALPARGSDRNFSRVTVGEQSAILVHYDPNRQENNYYADIATFLKSIQVPVPSVYGHDENRCLLLLEDMGNIDLYSFKRTKPEIRLPLYHKVVRNIHALHSFPYELFPSGNVRLMGSFDETLYKWEHNYFTMHFVDGFCGIKVSVSRFAKLTDELSILIGHFRDTRLCLVHRDLQSQNIMMLRGEPYFIDFQGMRFGNMFYDLGSLLNDPYMMLSEEEVSTLLSSYYNLATKAVEWPEFVNSFWEASVQRLMQALGAYGFLSRHKGLNVFLEHIPAGLAKIESAANHIPWLQCLNELIAECRNTQFGNPRND